MSLNYRRMPKDTITVETIALSAVIGMQLPGRAIDFLKLDVEAAEDIVLSDLAITGGLKAVREALIEFHHRIDGERAKLGWFLPTLEAQGFDYQIDAVSMPLYSRIRFQNITLYAYRA
jgi:hypothetical protein